LFNSLPDDALESDDMITDDSRPIALRSSATITANSDAEVSAGPLVNSSGEPMEIHEFIFSVRPVDLSIANYASAGLFPSGGQFAIGLSVKDGSDFGYALTNGVIPLWSFGQARQLGEEEKLQSLQPDLSGVLTVNGFLTAVYSWKLDHPLYVPPGARIVPVARSLGSFNGDVELGVSALGRVLPNTPKSRAAYKIPWVCAYVSKSFDYTEQGEDSSSDNALYNPFVDRLVTIERFVGRLHMSRSVTVDTIPAQTQVAVADTTFLDAAFPFASFGYFGNNYFSQIFSIRMRDSVGNPIVREKTLFRNVFESASRTWEVQQVLPPRQFHKVDFYKAATAAEWEITTPSRIQGSVASIGWREVSWKKS